MSIQWLRVRVPYTPPRFSAYKNDPEDHNRRCSSRRPAVASDETESGSFAFQLWNKHLPSGSLRSRLADGVLWSFTGAAISRGLNLLAMVLVARMVGKVGFGELGTVQSTVGMFAVFAGFGMGITATKHVAELR